MSKFTPGPWEWDGQILVRRIQDGERDHPILVGEWDEVILSTLDDIELAVEFVDGGGREYCDWSVNESNARLIAAAPDLLAAAEAMIAAQTQQEQGNDIEAGMLAGCALEMARAAIAKATGESQ